MNEKKGSYLASDFVLLGSTKRKMGPIKWVFIDKEEDVSLISVVFDFVYYV